MSQEPSGGAHAPETLEGWYSLHDSYVARGDGEARERAVAAMGTSVAALNEERRGDGWSCVVSLIGGPADLLVMHLRPTIEDLQKARSAVESAVHGDAERSWSLLGVTEAGLYHITAELARAAEARGGSVGDEQYAAAVRDRTAAEAASDHVRKRLYPEHPRDLPYVSFYPMSKRRSPGQNWYTLGLEERSRLMRAHGVTGRKYAGRVQQIITGSIGLAQWEWGVTLFARDPLDIKRLVTDMRFDEVSAEYAEFGEFYVGKVI